MNRNWLYFGILVILAVIAYFTLIRDNEGSYSKKDTAFAVEDTTAIGKILLTNLKGDSILLEQHNGSWTMNKDYRPRPDAIHNLLNTMVQLEVKMPVAKSMHNTVIKKIAGKRTHVEVFNGKGEKTKGFYIGDNTDQLNGTFMLMENSDHAFVVNIPGFAGFAATVFFTDETDWKSKNIFAYKPDVINQIDITYNNLRDSSFSIVRKADNTFELIGNKNINKPLNPEIVSYYLKQFGMLNAEYFILEPEKRDSLLATTPACIMSVTDNNKTTTTLKIYYRPLTYRSKMQYTLDDKPIEFDLDKYYGVFNEDKDLGIIQNFVFGKLMVGPQFFYRQRPGNVSVLNEGLKK
ncbi:MAG: DUF4340 domain-containing protein [Chitinophagales bacterium]|jgi:hypothetical protein|nr:DUF4340 domain-containing protein [Bacteroidota bacterium]MBK9556358.1 DUF4340 domain-containing protein [Bacteroidota bacterium]MBL0280799.1 DUF4340 domain-containing protein [Bacteroidota bacterium]MBP8248671.1 DUF4340 domain-containing protein [Chitinophagales bacterium]MBP9879534.1 DUF4340 domain-containing protein [Chitinophagales bacterium]